MISYLVFLPVRDLEGFGVYLSPDLSEDSLGSAVRTRHDSRTRPRIRSSHVRGWASSVKTAPACTRYSRCQIVRRNDFPCTPSVGRSRIVPARMTFFTDSGVIVFPEQISGESVSDVPFSWAVTCDGYPHSSAIAPPASRRVDRQEFWIRRRSDQRATLSRPMSRNFWRRRSEAGSPWVQSFMKSITFPAIVSCSFLLIYFGYGKEGAVSLGARWGRLSSLPVLICDNGRLESLPHIWFILSISSSGGRQTSRRAFWLSS